MGKLPRLLDKQMHEVRPLYPSKLKVTMNLVPISTAQMTLDVGEEEVSIREFVEIYRGEESLGIFRVSSCSPGTGERDNIELEHALCTLGDDLTARETTLEGTPRTILSTILGFQSTVHWVLDFAPNSGNYSLEVDRTRLLQAINELVKQIPGYAVTYDQSVYPWKISIVKLTETHDSECRLSRNMPNVVITQDDHDLCTRVYAPHLANGYMDADTVNTWGVVADVLDVSDSVNAEKVISYAHEVLENRKNPTISIEIDATDLSEYTGEPLDKFRLGGLCRVAIPEWNITQDERIIKMRFDDLLEAPELVSLTLSKIPMNTSRLIAELRSGARRSAGGIRKLGDRIEYTYDYAVGIGEDLQVFHNEVSFEMDAMNATINLKASQSEMNMLSMSLREAEIAIDGANAQIALKASQTELNALGQRVSSAEITLDGVNASIELKVSKNGVISSINQTSEEIKIQAGKINLSGYVTASELSATNASITNLTSGLTTSVTLKAVLFSGGNFDGGTVTADFVNAAGMRHGGKLIQRRTLTVSTPSGSKTINYLGYVP